MARKELPDPLVDPESNAVTGPGSRFSWTTNASSTNYPTPPASAGLPPQSLVERLPHSPARLSKRTTGDSTATNASTNTNPFRRSASRNHDNSTLVQPNQVRQSSTISSKENRNSSYKKSNCNNPFLPTPPASASPRHERFHSASNTGELLSLPTGANTSRSRSNGHDKGIDSRSSNGNIPGHRRAISLSERFPGDRSHQPLDIIRKDSRAARRAPHLTRKYLPGPDQIDRLDNVIMRYHHEGPYDAALTSRNLSPKLSPLMAVRDTNTEAIKATPEENVRDAVVRHRPLDGTAIIPSGMPDRFGRVYHYEEGTDLMREDGADYMRWPGLTYHKEDLKGKGEPSFSLDRALKERKKQQQLHGGRQEDIELVSRPRRGTDTDYDVAYSTSRVRHTGYGTRDDDESNNGRSIDTGANMARRRNSTGGRKLSDGFRRKFSGLAKRRDQRG